MNRKWSIVLTYRFFSLPIHIHLFKINFSKKIRNVFKNSLDIGGLYLNILLSPCVYFDNLLFLNSWLCFLYFFHCPAISEHVTSNASDSESSYRKLLLWFVILFFATAPLPVVFISDFCCCFSIAALYHPHPKQMAWNEIIIWCGKIQKTRGPWVN